MEWNEEGRLEYSVYSKPNQQIKYLHKSSNHTNACKKAIPKGVFLRLSKLTSSTPLNQDQRLDTLYPAHTAALNKAELAPSTFPKLSELKNNESGTNENSSKTERKNSPGVTHFS